ncbi:unnamed protein product [Rhizoctonia solani]|uniref:Uncharacterized protein n=1 Tax=Rhizoctonia solani TaxID=456999 RepID=A0A8H3BJU8_9AGAM|nr:unnamed protein product [Rhizoctonia solani]
MASKPSLPTIVTSADTTDPTPFDQKPLVLASFIDPKSLSSLESMGDTEGLLRGLGNDIKPGLRRWRYADSEQGHCPEKGEGGGAGAGGDAPQPRASVGGGERVYGVNVMPWPPIPTKKASISGMKSEGSTSPSTTSERSPGSGSATLKFLGRKTLDSLKRVMDSAGVVPGLSHILETFEKLQNEFEAQEARFLRHLGALSSIIEPCLGGQAPKGANASPNNNLTELHSTIESVRDALRGHASAGKPHSRILDAKEHQRRFEEATDSFRNWTNEWIVRSVTNLEQKFEGLESRMRKLDSRVQGLAGIMQGLVIH